MEWLERERGGEVSGGDRCVLPVMEAHRPRARHAELASESVRLSLVEHCEDDVVVGLERPITRCNEAPAIAGDQLERIVLAGKEDRTLKAGRLLLQPAEPGLLRVVIRGAEELADRAGVLNTCPLPAAERIDRD